MAGSSFGIVTEFHYRIFPEPEVLPVVAVIYIEDKADLWRIDAAGRSKFTLILLIKEGMNTNLSDR